MDDSKLKGKTKCYHGHEYVEGSYSAIPRKNSKTWEITCLICKRLQSKQSYARIGKRRNACAYGHEYTPENTFEPEGGTRRCMTCNPINRCIQKHDLTEYPLEIRKSMWAKCPRCPEAPTTQRAIKREERILKESDKLVSMNKLDYLKQTLDQAQASDNLGFAVESDGRPLCEVPEIRVNAEGKEYKYFPHIDYDERTPPGVVEAMKMCFACPVLEQCAEYARTLRPKTGVWGGEVYVDGKITYS